MYMYESSWDSPSWGEALCWSETYIRKIWLKSLITFASPQQGDWNFLGGGCMHYNIDLALIPGSCVSKERGSVVRTVCIHRFWVCKISFITLLNFLRHLIPIPVIHILVIVTVVQAPNLVRQMLTVGRVPWQVSWDQNALQHSTMQDKIQHEKAGF